MEVTPVVSPEKGSNNIGGEVLNVGNVVMPNGDVVNMNNRSVRLKSPPELI